MLQKKLGYIKLNGESILIEKFVVLANGMLFIDQPISKLTMGVHFARQS